MSALGEQQGVVVGHRAVDHHNVLTVLGEVLVMIGDVAALLRPDGDTIEGDISSKVIGLDEAIISDYRYILRLRLRHNCSRGSSVMRGNHQDAVALRQVCLSLAELGGIAARGVVI